jgi:transposase
MEVLHPRCAGLDVHKDTVVAAVRCVSAPSQHEVRSFATTTDGARLHARRDGGHGRLLEAHLARARS